MLEGRRLYRNLSTQLQVTCITALKLSSGGGRGYPVGRREIDQRTNCTGMKQMWYRLLNHVKIERNKGGGRVEQMYKINISDITASDRCGFSNLVRPDPVGPLPVRIFVLICQLLQERGLSKETENCHQR